MKIDSPGSVLAILEAEMGKVMRQYEDIPVALRSVCAKRTRVNKSKVSEILTRGKQGLTHKKVMAYIEE